MTEHLSANEAMEFLRVSRNQLYRLIDAGKIIAYKPAGRLIFKRSELIEYINDGLIMPKMTAYHNTRKKQQRKSKYIPGEKWV